MQIGDKVMLRWKVYDNKFLQFLVGKRLTILSINKHGEARCYFNQLINLDIPLMQLKYYEGPQNKYIDTDYI